MLYQSLVLATLIAASCAGPLAASKRQSPDSETWDENGNFRLECKSTNNYGRGN